MILLLGLALLALALAPARGLVLSSACPGPGPGPARAVVDAAEAEGWRAVLESPSSPPAARWMAVESEKERKEEELGERGSSGWMGVI